MLRRKLVVVTVAAISGGLYGAVAATAGEVREYPTFIQGEFARAKITASGNVRYKKFGGEIGSPASDCVSGRKVSLYRKRYGDKRKLGTDTTDAAGKWSIKVSSTNGKYLYKVKRKEIAPVEAGEALVCLGVKSRSKLDAR